ELGGERGRRGPNVRLYPPCPYARAQHGAVPQRRDEMATRPIARAVARLVGGVSPPRAKGSAEIAPQRTRDRALLRHEIVVVGVIGAIYARGDFRAERGPHDPLEVARGTIFRRHRPSADRIRFREPG